MPQSSVWRQLKPVVESGRSMKCYSMLLVLGLSIHRPQPTPMLSERARREFREKEYSDAERDFREIAKTDVQVVHPFSIWVRHCSNAQRMRRKVRVTRYRLRNACSRLPDSPAGNGSALPPRSPPHLRSLQRAAAPSASSFTPCAAP